MEQLTVQDMLGSLGVNTRKVQESMSMTTSTPKLEYLFEDEYKTAGPSLGSRVCHGTGLSYLTGLGLGGLWGLVEGLGNKEAKTSRLRLNAVLNQCTRRGPFLANNIGILALFYNFTHGLALKYLEREADIMSISSSAALSGFVFRFAKGPQSAIVAALACGSLMGTIEFLRNRESYIFSLQQVYNASVRPPTAPQPSAL